MSDAEDGPWPPPGGATLLDAVLAYIHPTQCDEFRLLISEARIGTPDFINGSTEAETRFEEITQEATAALWKDLENGELRIEGFEYILGKEAEAFGVGRKAVPVMADQAKRFEIIAWSNTPFVRKEILQFDPALLTNAIQPKGVPLSYMLIDVRVYQGDHTTQSVADTKKYDDTVVTLTSSRSDKKSGGPRSQRDLALEKEATAALIAYGRKNKGQAPGGRRSTTIEWLIDEFPILGKNARDRVWDKSVASFPEWGYAGKKKNIPDN